MTKMMKNGMDILALGGIWVALAFWAEIIQAVTG